MALKAKLDTIEGLSADVAREYKVVEEGGRKFYTLDVEGAYLHDEDIGPLKRAKDYEKKGRVEAETKLKEATALVEAAKEELDQMRRGAIPKGDVEKLEGSWKEKLAAAKAESEGRLQKAQSTLQKLLVDNVAQSIASKISTAPDLILPHVKARLTAEDTSDGFVTRVLDREGKPSAFTLEELQKDLATDKRFGAIIIGSKASGGGAAGGDDRGGAPVVDPNFDINKATPKQLAAHIKAQKEASGQ